MRIVGVYSFNQGAEILKSDYPNELDEIYEVLESVDAEIHKNKVSKEKTTKGEIFYSPRPLNKAIKKLFYQRNWESPRLKCDYPTKYYVDGYQPEKEIKGTPFREMDYIKNRVGIEVQFGKYSFMVYNVAAKMTIFSNEDIIDVGVEIVPVKDMADRMSSGVSYFEQFVWDLERRGVADIDIPVLILGILPDNVARDGR
ncbi:MAG: BglII/BstYI family type II restriction endonuclease [Chloroflexota bacterium]|nr:BglII/BstYI family type II restriction endonuclease [Chloroflexota bacterium]